MAANSNPIFSRIGDIQWGGAAATAANTTVDLTSGTKYTIFTSDATNGGRLEKIKFRPLGTNVATVARIWINNGATPGTAANNSLYHEVTLPATTVSQVAAQTDIYATLELALPPGYVVYVTLGTAVAAGFHITGVGGKY